MPRVKGSGVARRRHKKVLKQARGYWGRRHSTFKAAHEAVMHALQYAYRDRRTRKRQFRSLWISRINAAARLHGITYSRLAEGLRKAGVEINRKALADLAVSDATAFKELAELAKGQVGAENKSAYPA